MFAETGLFSVYAGTTPKRAHEVLSIVRGEMDEIAAGGLSEDELERAKGHLKGSLVLSLEDTSGRMSRIGRSEIAHGEILSVDELLARTDAVTKEDAERSAGEVFARPIALAVIGPFEAEAFAGGFGAILSAGTVGATPAPGEADVSIAAHSGGRG